MYIYMYIYIYVHTYIYKHIYMNLHAAPWHAAGSGYRPNPLPSAAHQALSIVAHVQGVILCSEMYSHVHRISAYIVK